MKGARLLYIDEESENANIITQQKIMNTRIFFSFVIFLFAFSRFYPYFIWRA